MKTNFITGERAKGTTVSAVRGAIVLSVATASEREAIYRLRHEIYAAELGQHAPNPNGRLCDGLDTVNVYLVASVGGQIAGFVSVTPPGEKGYSIDKYFARELFPFPFDGGLYEIRLLTVLKPHRGRELATLLMYAAFRWVEAHGGTRIVGIGRREVLEMYRRSGLKPLGLSTRAGEVIYEAMETTVGDLREHMKSFGGLLERLAGKTEWRLSFPFKKPAACFHGGAFFEAVGPDFEALERSKEIINADVLDAWFPPSPKVINGLRDYLPWLLRTSPPTACEGLVRAIARARGVAPGNILPGAGSSDLIFRALRHWLRPASHVLILDPTYGEYAHVLERVIGCTVDRLTLLEKNDYEVDLDRLSAALGDGYDMVVLVNPNSPTGRHVARKRLEEVLSRAPAATRVWIDETYIEYAGADESLEPFAVRSENVIVCKSMSKVYALSGARAAYLCGSPHQLEELRAITPPWVVSLPAQVAGVYALSDPEYYAARYVETAELRAELVVELSRLGLEIVPGIANFLLARLSSAGPDAGMVVKRCRERGLFIRDAGAMGSQLGDRSLRIAVKDRETNQKALSILKSVLGG